MEHRPVITIYTDPRTIYTQPSDSYEPPDRPHRGPRPAAPAASVPTEPPPPVPQPPTTPKTWQRSHRQSLTTRTAQASMPSMPVMLPSRGSTTDVDVGNRVHQSLQRPKLLRGGEWQLSLMTNLIAAGFVILAIMQWNWRFLPGAFVFGCLIQWPLRQMAIHDPKRWQKYMRTINQPLIREPHSKPGDTSPAPRILPKPSWFIH